MRFSVRHETLYRYSTPVRLAPHVLRLHPRPDNARILAESLTVDPLPAMRREERDGFGNRVSRLDFAGETEHLRIEARFDVETLMPAPLLDPGWPGLPWPQPDESPAPSGADAAPEPAVQAFAAEMAGAAAGAALPFLETLCRALFDRVTHHVRVEGPARSPAETLALRSGACRDIAVLFMAACRSQGIAARFVSGYQARAGTQGPERHMHAWPEVLLPGLGWRGFDPTHGIAVTDGHLALCAAAEQAETMPVEGGFFGNGVTATLDYRVSIEAA